MTTEVCFISFGGKNNTKFDAKQLDNSTLMGKWLFSPFRWNYFSKISMFTKGLIIGESDRSWWC